MIKRNSEKSKSQDRRRKQVATAVQTYRDRQKQELEFLRSRVSELEATLHRLQGYGYLANHGSWEEACNQQKLQRQLAELENETLRANIQSQMQAQHHLQRLLLGLHCDCELQEIHLTSSNPEKRAEIVAETCKNDFEHVIHRSSKLRYHMDHFPYMNQWRYEQNGKTHVEMHRGLFFVGFSAHDVAKAIDKIFSKQVDLPTVPGIQLGFEALEEISSEISYARIVCSFGTTSNGVPTTEKLTIYSKRIEYGTAPIFTWRTVNHDMLHPIGIHPRTHEVGNILIENGCWKGDQGTLLTVFLSTEPPTNMIDGYMTGCTEYLHRLEELVSFLLMVSSLL